MGAWQAALRDALGLDTAATTTIGACTFLGALFAMLGGKAFDALGPRISCALGGCLFTTGYVLIGTTVVFAAYLPTAAKVAMPALGSSFAGYSSVSLLDNVVCMACSLSFPEDRAAIVGYLKAVLASAAGLWALLWVHVFRDNFGLVPFIGFTACYALGSTLLCLLGIKVLDPGPDRRAFDSSDFRRLALAIIYTVSLAVFSVVVSFCYSNGIIQTTSALGFAGFVLAALPLTLLPLPSGSTATVGPNLSEPLMPAPKDEVDIYRQKQAAAQAAMVDSRPLRGDALIRKLKAAAQTVLVSQNILRGVRFGDAVVGLDFWLLFVMQLAVFGGGVAANQNLALIFESARSPSASGLGVALFALASTVSRVSVGVLSDKFSHVMSRFGWLVLVSACAVLGQLLLAIMSPPLILCGTFVLGLSFGSFFTLIVPVVNEMYGQRQFGVIMGSQLGSQAIAAVSISVELMPTVYRMASHGAGVCYGVDCFLDSFLALAALNAVGLGAAIWLKQRNSNDLPVDRLRS